MYHPSVVAPGFQVCQDDGIEGEVLLLGEVQDSSLLSKLDERNTLPPPG